MPSLEADGWISQITVSLISFSHVVVGSVLFEFVSD
jgi:hypothetical protein